MRNTFYLNHCNEKIAESEMEIERILLIMERIGNNSVAMKCLKSKQKKKATYERIKNRIEKESA